MSLPAETGWLDCRQRGPGANWSPRIPVEAGGCKTKEDIESFLDRLDSGSAEVEELEAGIWMVRTAAGAEVLVQFAPPVVILRVAVMPLPAGVKKQAELFRAAAGATMRVNWCTAPTGWRAIGWCWWIRWNWRIWISTSSRRASIPLTLALATHLGALAPYRE